MLFRKHLCWSHNDRLIPTVYKSSCHDYSNLSFSSSCIALNKRLYSSSGLSIPQHILNCFILIFCQCKRQRLYNLVYHGPGLYVILTTGRDLCTVQLIVKGKIEQIVKQDSLSPLFDFLHSIGCVDIPERNRHRDFMI